MLGNRLQTRDIFNTYAEIDLDNFEHIIKYTYTYPYPCYISISLEYTALTQRSSPRASSRATWPRCSWASRNCATTLGGNGMGGAKGSCQTPHPFFGHPKCVEMGKYNQNIYEYSQSIMFFRKKYLYKSPLSCRT